MKKNPKTMTTVDARAQMCELINLAAYHTPVILTRRGKQIAVVISYADYKEKFRENLNP